MFCLRYGTIFYDMRIQNTTRNTELLFRLATFGVILVLLLGLIGGLFWFINVTHSCQTTYIRESKEDVIETGCST